MESILNLVPAQPRTVAIAYRSWLGSSQTLVAAADELLMATGRMQGTGGTMFWYVEPGTPRKFLVVNGVAGKTTMSIAQIQGLLRAIEERLNEGQPARVGGLLKADLLWVEGTTLDTPDLRLPNPDLLNTDWGLEAFVAAAEDPFAYACKHGGESTIFCHEVGAKYRSTKRTRVQEMTADSWFYGESTATDMMFRGIAQETTEDIIAQSIATLALAAGAYYFPPTSDWNRRYIGEYAEGFLQKIRSTEFLPVHAAAAPGAGTEASVESWVNAARAAADKAGLAVARSVVFHVGTDGIRGAILGAKVSASQPGPLPPVSKIDVKRGDTPLDPTRQPQTWGVEVHVPFPKPQPHPSGATPGGANQ